MSISGIFRKLILSRGYIYFESKGARNKGAKNEKKGSQKEGEPKVDEVRYS